MTTVPISLQVAQAECGLCCARSVLASHGQDVSLTELRGVIEPGRDGLSLKQVSDLLRARGMRTQMLRVRALPGLSALQAPFIAHWRGYHFVVVERVTAGGAVIMDPMVGRTRINRAELEADFSGKVVVAEPGPDFVTARRPPFAAWRGKPIWPHSVTKWYVAMVLLSLGVFGFTLGIPLLTQSLVDDVTVADGGLARSLATVIAVGAGFIGVLVARTIVLTVVVRAVSWQLLTSAFEHLVRLPLMYFMSRPPGELIYRMNSLGQVQDLIASRIVQGVLDALSAMVLVGYVFWVAPSLGATVLAIASVVVLVLVLSRRLVKSATDREVHHAGRAHSIQLDAVVSITNLRIGGYAQSYLDDWRKAYSDALTAMTRRIRVQQGWLGSVVVGVQSFAPLAILIVSLSWVRTGTVTLGQAVAVQGVSALLFSLSASVFQAWTEGVVASRYLERVDDIYASEPEPAGGNRHKLPHNGITLNHVSFRYTDHSPDVLRDIDITIAPGAVVALVGESGSGKTTLGKLLCSLYGPTSGTVSFGGVAAHEYNLESLRRSIGYIPQEGYLHNRTLAENLTLGTSATADEAMEFCRELPFMGFVDEMPMGYRTVVSEMGANLSGGQRQRIAVAKALLRRPAILVMDEATSAMDNANQKLVHDSIAQLDCTQVIIAHRFSTVVHADQILVMHEGRLEQVGTHAELAVSGGVYARLFSTGREAVRG